MSFTFGAPTASSTSAPTFGFGTTTTSASTGFGGFGTQPKTTASTGFGFTGFGGFGTQPKTTAAGTTGLGFGTGTSTGTTGFGFGAGTSGTTTGTFGFGGTTTSTAPTGFGFGGGTTGLGTGTSTGFSGFGTTGGTTGFGLGTGGTTLGGFGLGAQQQQQQQASSTLENLGTAVTLPQIYGDERDAIIAKWNQLLAYWGTGKGYYSQNGAVDFTSENPYCRFKAVGYTRLPRTKNEDGLVSIFINKKESDVTTNQQQIQDTLFKIMGSRPQFSVCVEGIKRLPDDKTELVIYILERPATGPARRVPASDTFNFLNQPAQQGQLKTQLDVQSVIPKTGLTDQALKEYLDTPPAGIHPLLWQQAKVDNPDPSNLIPIPMIGFKALHERMKHQEQQTKAHQQRLDLIASDLQELQQKESNMVAKLEEFKCKYLELSHRILKVVVKQEISRKMGYAIQAEEEQLRVQLEKIQLELNHPTQFKGRLNELMSQIRMQNQLSGSRSDVSYQLDAGLQQEIKQLLKQQQEGLKHLVDIIKEDSHDLQLIEENLGSKR
ncbi:hypothetical protein FSP39_007976 [Pinctada imbricata]|uniref:Nuclear pore complex protein Nup54 n=1 Tax=Pinctada imbricata TaxID=66713 RepID=A0AA88Y729_PINIB|nr:hypothetical protein FSP39_007976 [Pinctada imbricata]